MRETIPVTVFVAQGQLEASVVKSRLESEGIPVILQYESLGVVYGLTVNGLGQVKVMVPQPLEAQARAILEAALAEDVESEEEESEEEDESTQNDEDAQAS